jgi:hypothetical protein
VSFEERLGRFQKMSVDERMQAIKNYAQNEGLYIDIGALGDCWVWLIDTWELGVKIANAENQCRVCVIRTRRNQGRCPILEYLNLDVFPS